MRGALNTRSEGRQPCRSLTTQTEEGCPEPELPLLERIVFLTPPNGEPRAEPAVQVPEWEASAGAGVGGWQRE